MAANSSYNTFLTDLNMITGHGLTFYLSDSSVEQETKCNAWNMRHSRVNKKPVSMITDQNSGQYWFHKSILVDWSILVN